MTATPSPVYQTVRDERSSEHAGSFKREKRLEGLPFTFAVNAIGTYPDTGESGDAYDAETFLEADHW